MATPRKPIKKPFPKNRNARLVKRVVTNTSQVSQKKSWRLTSFLAIVILFLLTSLVIGFAWISFLFIFQPQQIAWINKLLPQWAQINVSSEAQTITQIEAALNKLGLQKGDIVSTDDADSFLLPVYKQRLNCQSDCKEIVELRVYQQASDLEFRSEPEKHYQLTTQIAIAGPEESFVIAPLVNATNENQGSSISLPVTEISRLEGASGTWYYLLGRRQEGTYNINYGHILYYNPTRYHIQQLISWTSPTGELPQWQQVTGNSNKELVINQTVGLEPQLQVYQVKSVKTFLNPVELNEITLKPPALKDSSYEKALSIARSGLWTPAYDWLKFIKKQKKNIPPSAQAQIDVIRMHSQISKAQAATTWASPSQQVLANLIDGRWAKALEAFKAAPLQNSKEISQSLQADSGRLWSRVEAALQVNPNREEVQAWGALILAAQYGDTRAYSWLKEEFKGKQVNLASIQVLLKQLKGEATTQLPTATHASKIIGSVQSVENKQVNLSDWLQIGTENSTINLSNNQKWYQVKVSAFYDGKNWLKAPFTTLNLPAVAPSKYLRSILGLENDATLQIAAWQANGEQQSTTATIKAVQYKNGVLHLLAQPDNFINVSISNTSKLQQPQALATSTYALEWIQPTPTTLGQLQTLDSQRGNTILKAIWRALQTTNSIKKSNVNIQTIGQKLGHWPVQEIDITGNGKPEIVLTATNEAIASLYPDPKTQNKKNVNSRPRTLILSDNSSIIYTDFGLNTEQSLIAVANLSQTSLPSLLIENANGYSLKRWSQKNQRFE
ncbi:hypothetical protein NIES4071_97140 [Calothrix sp. NIES-4071]|nr:hypothetical protein NIES4071_97140 [Calothrix sp. NIES-4071]BAZ63979.1 hypothetical protein NIES4105_97070 [Calothrix sp. NIES-4105]